MAMQRVRTLQAFLMCVMMVLSVQSVGLSAVLDAGNEPLPSEQPRAPPAAMNTVGATLP